MSAFRKFMLQEYPYYENAGVKNVEMWEHIWDAAIKHAEALKPSHNKRKPKLCPYCNGRGWVHVNNMVNQIEEQGCTKCGGSGKLRT